MPAVHGRRRALPFLLLWISAALVKCQKYALLTLQKDETELLRDWILHHGGIFGYENLHIIDQHSESPMAQQWLQIAERAGAHVTWFKGEYQERPKIVTGKIHEIFTKNPAVDIVIPLDADEFIVAQDTSEVGVYSPAAAETPRYSADPELVLATLDALPRDGFKYKFNEVVAADCPRDEGRLLASEDKEGAEDKKGRSADMAEQLAGTLEDLLPKRRVVSAQHFSQSAFGSGRKTFYYREGFISTDMGNHKGRVERDEECEGMSEGSQGGDLVVDRGRCYHRTTLAVIHYGVRALSFDAFKAKMQRGASAHGFDGQTDCSKVLVAHMYCNQNQLILQDEEEALKFWEDRVCKGIKYAVSSDFVVRSVAGDYSGTLDFLADAP